MANRLVFDVFGKRMVVEPSSEGWKLFRLGSDGKRAPVDVAIPHFVAEDELLQYLDDLYHELGTREHPSVTRVRDA